MVLSKTKKKRKHRHNFHKHLKNRVKWPLKSQLFISVGLNQYMFVTRTKHVFDCFDEVWHFINPLVGVVAPSKLNLFMWYTPQNCLSQVKSQPMKPLAAISSSSVLMTHAWQVSHAQGGTWVPWRFCCARWPWQQPLGWGGKVCTAAGPGQCECNQLSSASPVMCQWHKEQGGDTHVIWRQGLCIRKRVCNGSAVFSMAGCLWKFDHSGGTFPRHK